MAHYGSAGHVPRKRHTQHHRPDGRLYRSEGLLLRLLAALPPRRAACPRRSSMTARGSCPTSGRHPAVRCCRAPSGCTSCSRGRGGRADAVTGPAPGPRQRRRAAVVRRGWGPRRSTGNATDDECVFVKAGTATVKTVFGSLDVSAGALLRAGRAATGPSGPTSPAVWCAQRPPGVRRRRGSALSGRRWWGSRLPHPPGSRRALARQGAVGPEPALQRRWWQIVMGCSWNADRGSVENGTGGAGSSAGAGRDHRADLGPEGLDRGAEVRCVDIHARGRWSPARAPARGCGVAVRARPGDGGPVQAGQSASEAPGGRASAIAAPRGTAAAVPPTISFRRLRDLDGSPPVSCTPPPWPVPPLSDGATDHADAARVRRVAGPVDDVPVTEPLRARGRPPAAQIGRAHV